MDIEKLFAVLPLSDPPSESFKASLQQEAIYLSLPKNHFLVEAPRPTDHVYLLEDGFAIGLVFEEGQKKIHSFWGAGDVVLTPQGCFERAHPVEFVQLTEGSNVWCLHHTAVENLFELFKEARALYRLVLGRYYALTQSRLFDLQHRDTWQRYEKLLHQFPHLEQRISQEYIASYLGITPQSLSRMKREQRKRNS